jgi:Family of unknown function (DUF5681)
MRKSIPPWQGPTYEIGKGRPPVDTRWKPGQSGNPRGRPKGSKCFAELIKASLNQSVKIQIGGRIRSVSKRQAIAEMIVRDAVRGDAKARKTLLDLGPEIEPKREITRIKRVIVDVKDGEIVGPIPGGLIPKKLISDLNILESVEGSPQFADLPSQSTAPQDSADNDQNTRDQCSGIESGYEAKFKAGLKPFRRVFVDVKDGEIVGRVSEEKWQKD